MEKILSLVVTLAAYSDTPLGFALRLKMVKPVAFFQPELADYIAIMVHI